VFTRAPLKPCETFRNKFFNCGELLAPHATVELEGHPLSAVRDCLLKTQFTLHIDWSSVIRNTFHKMLWSWNIWVRR